MAEQKKKPFKETKLGKFLGEKAPAVLDAVGDILPDQGVLGVVKNVFEKIQGITPEERKEFEKLVQEYEKEIFTLEIQDRASARTRETEFVKSTGHIDWMQVCVGITVMLSFVSLQYALINLHIPDENRDTFMHMVGMIDTSVGLVIGYYFGSSKGSHDKSKLLRQ